MKQRMVWVELYNGWACRIFKSEKAAFAAPSCTITEMPYAEAVSHVRGLIWLRCRGECEKCSRPVTEDSGHMHEEKHRGRGGEISVDNSIFICQNCHRFAHRERNPRWSKNQNE